MTTERAPDVAEQGFVVVTGASTGIGYACALHLDRLGFRVFAGVRKVEDGERLQQAASLRLVPLTIDVTDAASIAAAAAEVERATGSDGLAGLVNNAGIALTGPLEFIEVDRLRRQFEVNFFGQIAVTQAFLPTIRRGGGRIVNMSSMAGRVAPPFYGPYTASKHALEAASDSLRGELAPWGIHVALVEPGAIDTPIWEKGLGEAHEAINALSPAARERYGEVMQTVLQDVEGQGTRGIPTEAVSEAVVHALTAKRPRIRYVVGRDAIIATTARRFLPDRLMDRLLWRQMHMPRRGSLKD
jgi:NAD(P)-dependent dehydrogenase (short-subunit alcohol dehydrogenase family)